MADAASGARIAVAAIAIQTYGKDGAPTMAGHLQSYLESLQSDPQSGYARPSFGPNIAILAPLLGNLPEWKELVERHGDPDKYVHFNHAQILLDRTRLGDREAGVELLQRNRQFPDMQIRGWRALMRDIGPWEAAQYLRFIPPDYRQRAIYYGVLAAVRLNEQATLAPPTIDMDRLTGTETLYKQAAACSQAWEITPLPKAVQWAFGDIALRNAAAPYEMNYRLVLARIRTVDPQLEPWLLDQLVKNEDRSGRISTRL